MIEHIRTVGFKGFDLDEDVPQKVIYTGPNKKGKTARSGAIAVTIYGYIPFSTAGKRPGDILDSFGDGKLLTSFVKIGGKEFGRKFSRNEKGVVSMAMQYEGKRVSSENFAILLNKAGDPRIANVAKFMEKSETKKIDTLFDLFPNPELAGIDTEIEAAKADVSKWQKKKDGAESTVVRLTNSKQSIEIPAGSIADVKAQIKAIETQIIDLDEQISDAKIEEARVKAEEEAKIKADREAEAQIKKAKEDGVVEGERIEKERVKKEADKKKADESGGVSLEEAKRMIGSMSPGENHEQIIPENDGDDYSVNQEAFLGFPSSPIVSNFPHPLDKKVVENESDDPIDEVIHGSQYSAVADRNKITNQTYAKASILRIIDALNGAGCVTCAALIVAKQELKKFKEVS